MRQSPQQTLVRHCRRRHASLGHSLRSDGSLLQIWIVYTQGRKHIQVVELQQCYDLHLPKHKTRYENNQERTAAYLIGSSIQQVELQHFLVFFLLYLPKHKTRYENNQAKNSCLLGWLINSLSLSLSLSQSASEAEAGGVAGRRYTDKLRG